VRLLLDTHILLWTIAESRRLSAGARALIGDAGSEITFTRQSLGRCNQDRPRRSDFRIDVGSLRRHLLDNRFTELAVTGAQARMQWRSRPCRGFTGIRSRMLVAQAMVEGVTLVTGDRAVARYPGPIRLV
jgi:PIN domain nuclease of toxin-antitoxin system